MPNLWHTPPCPTGMCQHTLHPPARRVHRPDRAPLSRHECCIMTLCAVTDTLRRWLSAQPEGHRERGCRLCVGAACSSYWGGPASGMKASCPCLTGDWRGVHAGRVPSLPHPHCRAPAPGSTGRPGRVRLCGCAAATPTRQAEVREVRVPWMSPNVGCTPRF